MVTLYFFYVDLFLIDRLKTWVFYGFIWFFLQLKGRDFGFPLIILNFFIICQSILLRKKLNTSLQIIHFMLLCDLNLEHIKCFFFLQHKM